MSSAQLQSFVVLTSTSALVFALVIVGGPRLARLVFRQRLDAVRDDCTDEILNGKLRRVSSVDKFLAATERGAERAQGRTLARLLALYIACVQLKVRHPAPRPTYADLRPSEQKIMDDLDARVEHAYQSYLTWGSPIGWAQALLTLIARHLRPRGRLASMQNLAREAMSTDTASNQPERPQGTWTERIFAGR